MKIAIIILLIGALGAGVCNYFCKNNKENKMETPMLESAKGVDLYGDDEYVFLDVRTLNEHRAKAIPNSPVIPVQELESRVNELNKYKDKKIVVYCRSGNRSKRGTDILINHGFDAVNLEGGMNKWQGAVISGE
jgi:rhodanese-related sulfurtransferase